ncbi:MAG: ChaN family lipoprotein, partial [Planctomycetota bacterium]
TDETTHRVELAVYNQLLARRDKQVVLALEMFERDVQPQLDAYLAGKIGEQEFLEQTRPWSNYRSAYRPLIERAKAGSLPVIASNFPRPLRVRVSRGGAEAIEELPSKQRKWVPDEFYPNTDSYWRRVDNAVRGHVGMMSSRGDSSRLYSAQSLWDNSMGAACADALERNPGHLVLHINGGFHSAYWDGAVHQLKQREPEAKVKTVSITPSTNPPVVELKGKPVADYVVLAEARATDVNDGMWSVYARKEVNYRLHLPDEQAAARPLPLLIWFCDDGLSAEDGLKLWRTRLGSEAAIIAISPPYRQRLGDLSVGGRWFWADSFAADISTAITAAERAWGYVLRHYPIDPNRVVIGGRGTGATVTAGITLLTERMNLQTVAWKPRRYAKLKDFPLPLAELWGEDEPPCKSLRVLGAASEQDWWEPELQQYAEQGIETHWELLEEDPWRGDLQRVNAIRGALDLKPVAEPEGARGYLLADGLQPRESFWARLHAARMTAERDQWVTVLEQAPDSAAQRVSTKIQPEMFAEPGVLPRCPGPFGGTTVVVPLENDMVERWVNIEKNDPIAEQSRFHGVRVATLDKGSRQLAKVLKRLKSENRKNILIVPAMFCAEPEVMRQLQQAVRQFEDEMTFHWLPGLGGCDVDLAAKPTASQDLPLRHQLEVAVHPGESKIEVTDTVQLPLSLRAAGSEFTLSGELEVTASEPAVEKVVRQARERQKEAGNAAKAENGTKKTAER